MEGSASGEDFNISGNGSDNTSDLICAARNIQEDPVELPYPSALILTVKIFLILVYYSTFLVGTFLNIMVLYLVIAYKQLHSLSFAVALQIVILDLLQLLLVFSFRLVTVVSEEWLFGAGMCVFTGFIFLSVYIIRSFLMCVFMTDRLLSIFAPYFYPRHSKKIMVTLSVVAWVGPLLYQVPVFPGLLDCYSFLAPRSLCSFDSSCNRSCFMFANFFIGIVFGPTTILPVLLFVLLYCKVKEIKKRNNVVHASGGHTTTGTRDAQRKRDWKAAITFFLLFVTAFAFTSPATILSVTFSALLRVRGPSIVMYVILALSTSASSLLVVADPIVIMRHADFKEVLQQVRARVCGKLKGSQQEPPQQQIEHEAIEGATQNPAAAVSEF